MNQLIKKPANHRNQIITDQTLLPLSFADIREQLGLAGEQIPAQNLVDRTFTILRANQFDSSYQDDAHAYFCVIKPDDSPEVYTTVLGGQACVDILDAYAQSGNNQPFKVTLRLKDRGKMSYYFFE